jgi:basic membrane protein A
MKPDETKIYVIYSEENKKQSYNRLFSEGVKSFADEPGIVVTELERANARELEYAVQSACENGADMILAASAEPGEYIAKYGERYPEIRFVSVDVPVDLPNVQTVYLEKKEAFFIAGAAAAMFTESIESEGINEDPVVGWIGGMNIPVVQEYYQAFEQGARFVNPEIVVLEDYVGSWDDVQKGKDAVLSQIEQKADIIMSVASAAGQGILEGAMEYGVYLMENETELSDLIENPESEEQTIATGSDASMKYRIAIVASIAEKPEQVGAVLMEGLINNHFEGGSVRYLALKDGAVDFIFNTNADGLPLLPEEIRAQCKVITEKICSGEILVGNP